MSKVDPIELGQEILYVLQTHVRENPGDLPPGQLLAFARDLVKLETTRLAAQPAEQDHQEIGVAELLSRPGLPQDRRQELLEREYERLTRELAAVELALREINLADAVQTED